MEHNEQRMLYQWLTTGLAKGNCRIQLAYVEGDGQWWSWLFSDSAGIWCDHSNWQQALQTYSGSADPTLVTEDLFPCISAAWFALLGETVNAKLSQQPINYRLPKGIYPVITVDECQFVVVNIGAEKWQAAFADWTPFQAPPVQVTVKLLAGFIADCENIRHKHGYWLAGDVDIRQGEALLWWHEPLAIVTLTDVNQLWVKEIRPTVTFNQIPYLAQIATIDLPLAQLYTLIAAENLTGKVMLETRVCLLRNEQRVAWGELLTARTGMAFHCLELEK